MSKRQITIKPTCLRELLAFPTKRAASLWEKINWLVTDPFPDGKLKKKLRGWDNIYRLRVGDHRVFYRFGNDWVSLLGVRRRLEDTYREIPVSDSPPQLAPDFDDDLDELLAPPPPPPKNFTFEPESAEKPLPLAITKDWLREQNIPAAAHPFLLRCSTEEELLEAPVSGDVLARVLDVIYPPNLAAVAQQPDLVVPSTEHLVRYKEGDLLGFLLRLDEEQVRLTRWAMKGPTMVRGGAGTGKSTVALYRVKEVLESAGVANDATVLFATYTRALLNVTRQLLEQILSPTQMARVQVSTVDQVTREIVSRSRAVGALESDRETMKRLKKIRASFVPTAHSAFEAKRRKRALDRLSDQYILEEFDWIIDGRDLHSVEEYKTAPRPGRGVPLSESLRESLWDLRLAFLKDAGERFPALRKEALQLIRTGSVNPQWDHVFVDEAQDLSPAALALMAEVARTPEGLFFAADSKQSIYSRNYTWAAAHHRLQFRGRTAILRHNYRSTKEIDRAAFAVLRPEADEELDASNSIHDGPLPVLVRGVDTAGEAEWVARFVRQMARHLHLRPSAAAVLVPSASVGESLAQSLSNIGLAARYYAGRELDLAADIVKVITLYSAKGLEFPIVVAAGFEEGTYPVSEDFDDPGLFEQRMRHERRLLYVGLTRAMRGLMIVVPEGCRHDALLELGNNEWHVEDAR